MNNNMNDNMNNNMNNNNMNNIVYTLCQTYLDKSFYLIDMYKRLFVFAYRNNSNGNRIQI